MNRDEAPADFEIDGLLAPRPEHGANVAKKEEWLLRTFSELPRAPGAFGLTRMLAMAAAFLIGGAAVYLLLANQSRRGFEVVSVVVPVTTVRESPNEVAVLSPQEMELEAEKNVDRVASARAFRDAGNVYLLKRGDYRAALRCYGHFLDGAPAEELDIATDDTWLLTSLKRARLEDMNHAED